MITIQYGPWLPDLASTPFQMPDQQGPVQVPCADCLNVYYANGVYQSLPTAAAVAGSPNLSAQVVGANTVIDSAGIPVPMAGVSSVSGTTAIYYWNGNTWTSMTLNPAQLVLTTVAVSWSFTVFGTQYYGLIVPQQIWLLGTVAGSLYSGAPGATWNLVSGAPLATVMGVVGQFVMLGDLYGPSTGTTIGTGNASQVTFTGTLANVPTFPTSVDITVNGVSQGSDNGLGVLSGAGIVSGTVNYDTGAVSVTLTAAPGVGIVVAATNAPANRTRLQWSAIGNAQSWPTPLTNAAIAVQSGIQDLESTYGPIMFISGYPLYGVIFQRNAITRAQYIGGNVVFSWQTYSRNLGLSAKGAIVQVGPNNYFLSDQGFFYTDGANVTPIGTAQDNSAGMDAWFFANVNKAALSAIRAGYDGNKRNVFFAIPTGSNTSPDTLLCYNVVAGRWTRAAQPTEMIWMDNDGTNNRLGVIQQSSHAYSLLTGTPNTGYLESLDMEFSDGFVRDTNGVRPNGKLTSPTVTVGTRNTLQQSVTYNAGFAPDAFGAGFAPALTEGLYTRIRVSDTNAGSIHGATCDMVQGGLL